MEIITPLTKGKTGIAVSGGMDSMVLLCLYIKKGLDICVINIEHGIRGAESIKDSDFVASFCAEKNIECYRYSVDTIKESKKSGESIELCARRLRYQIFNKLIDEGKVSHIALAHHANDNAETILMRIIRGTGIKGLTGITDNERFLHPLIKRTRNEIEEYAKKNNVPYIEDSTNKQNIYTRNFLRNKVFSKIAERFNNYEQGFTRLAQNAEEAEEYINSNLLPIYKKENGLYLLIDQFNMAHSIIKKYTLMKLFSDMGVEKDIESKHLGYIMSLTQKENNRRINLPFQVVAIKEYEKLVFYKDEHVGSFCEKFDINKRYKFAGSEYSFSEIRENNFTGKVFDKEKIPQNAVIRTREDGDMFKKCNGRTKKLNDYFTDIKLPIKERNKILLIADNNDILVICGKEISDRVKIDEKTTKKIKVTKETL